MANKTGSKPVSKCKQVKFKSYKSREIMLGGGSAEPQIASIQILRRFKKNSDKWALTHWAVVVQFNCNNWIPLKPHKTQSKFCGLTVLPPVSTPRHWPGTEEWEAAESTFHFYQAMNPTSVWGQDNRGAWPGSVNDQIVKLLFIYQGLFFFHLTLTDLKTYVSGRGWDWRW